MQCQSHQRGSLFTIFHYERSFGHWTFWNIFSRETFVLSQVFKRSTLIKWFNDLFWKLSKITFDRTVFKLRSTFCGQMCVKTIDNMLVTIEPCVCFNLLVHRHKYRFYLQNIHVNWWKLARNTKKELCCFLGKNFLLYLYTIVNVCPVYLMQP